MADTAGVSDNSEFLIPKGIQRFHFSGGARFVHGGTMLQEVCVPVLQIKALQKPPQKNSRSAARWILSLTIR